MEISPNIRQILLEFLAEDAGICDLTAELLFPEDKRAKGVVKVKEDCVVACIREGAEVFRLCNCEVLQLVDDGDFVKAGHIILEVIGPAKGILLAERVSLNILMRACGIATATHRLVDKLKRAGLDRVRVAATRKTAPCMRYFDKKAVVAGGGDPHRFQLSDLVLIKDNHVKLIGSVEKAVKLARKRVSFTKKIEVEVEGPAEAYEAIKAGADIIMLDNWKTSEIEKFIRELEERGLRDKVIIELSGGITEENILEYAKLNPDIISLGWLTHSVKAVDIALEVV